jgi:hypothetical protein
MYVIYEHPLDYPEHFVVRRWFMKAKPEENISVAPIQGVTHEKDYPEARIRVGSQGVRTFCTKDPFSEVEVVCQLADSLDEARLLIPADRVRTTSKANDPAIIEVWL